MKSWSQKVKDAILDSNPMTWTETTYIPTPSTPLQIPRSLYPTTSGDDFVPEEMETSPRRSFRIGSTQLAMLPQSISESMLRNGVMRKIFTAKDILWCDNNCSGFYCWDHLVNMIYFEHEGDATTFIIARA